MIHTATPPPATPHRLQPKFWDSFLTSVLLAAVLTVGPLWAGGFRLWIILPTLAAISCLAIFQGARLCWRGPHLVGRFGDGIDSTVLAFLLYAALRYCTATVEFVARVEVLQIYSYATVFWIARYGLSRRRDVLYLLGALAVVGLLVAFAGYLFRFRPDLRPFNPELLKHYGARFCGTYGNPNHFAEFLVMTLGILISYCLFYRIAWTPRIIAFYLCGMVIAAVALSISRAGWLALACSLLVMAFFLVRHGKLKWYWASLGLVVVALGAIAFYLASNTARQRIEEIASYKQNGTWEGYVRIELACDALKVAADFPWLGTGPATFRYIHPRYQSATYSTLAEYTHNDYLNLLADYGLIGLAIGLAFIVLVTRRLLRHLGPLADTDQAFVLCSALCAWCAMLLHSTLDFNMHIPANAYVLFGLAGMGLRRSAAQAESAPGWLSRAGTGRILGGLIVIVGVAMLAVALYTARGYFPYYFAERDYKTSPVSAAFKLGQEAVKADPKSPIALRYLGDLYRNRAAAETDYAKRVEDAQKGAALFQLAAQANPLDDELLALQGLCYDFIGRYAEAYLIHTTVIKRQPYNGYFRQLLGLHFWRRNMLPEARAAFEMGARCPHGYIDNAKALNELNHILGVRRQQDQAPVPAHEPTLP